MVRFTLIRFNASMIRVTVDDSVVAWKNFVRARKKSHILFLQHL